MNHLVKASLFMLLVISAPLAGAADKQSRSTADSKLKLLFLGDNGHHQPARRASELLPALASRGIDVQYTDNIAETLNRDRLSQIDGLIVYANIDQISADQAEALQAFILDAAATSSVAQTNGLELRIGS